MEITIFAILVVIFVLVEYYYFSKLKKEPFSNYLGYLGCIGLSLVYLGYIGLSLGYLGYIGLSLGYLG